MKRKLLTLVALAYVLCANAQTTVTASDDLATQPQVVMYVAPNTIYHDKGAIKVINKNAQILNRGLMTAEKGVSVENGGKKSSDRPDPTNVTDWYKSGQFLLKWTDDGIDGATTSADPVGYGQLKVYYEKGAANDGQVSIEQTVKQFDGSYVSLGMPFIDFTGNSLSNAWGSQYNMYDSQCALDTYCSKWLYISVWSWNNDKLQFDPLQTPKTSAFQTYDNVSVNPNPAANATKANSLSVGGYYLINTSQYSVNFPNDLGKTAAGDPAGILKGAAPVYTGTLPSTSLSVTIPNTRATVKTLTSAKNPYNIQYSSYLIDPFEPEVAFGVDAEYAQGFMRLSNPFATNLDLSSLGKMQGIEGLAYISGGTADGTAVPRYLIGYKQVLAVGTGLDKGFVVGDVGDVTNSPVLIPPMHVFELKGTPDTVVKFTDDMQVFDYSLATATPGTNIQPLSAGATKMTTKAVTSANPFYQVALKLNNPNKEVYFNRTYVAANKNFATAEIKGETTNTEITSGYTGIYTVPELATGGIDPATADITLYINKISTNSQSVAIPVGIVVDPSKKDGTQFTFTADLFEDGKILKSQTSGKNTTAANFSDPSAKFIFHDKKENKFVDIDSNFSYSFTQSESTNDRFEIFWSNATMDNKDIEPVSGATVVYKSGSDYKVRFDKTWKSATVTVFNSAGQLVSAKANIDVVNDYVLPLNNGASTLYVVKIVSEKGDVVTKKVVK